MKPLVPIVLVSAIAVAGCNLAPKYQQPEMPVPSSFPEQPQLSFDAATGSVSRQTVAPEVIAPGSESAADMPWQTFFPDQTLQSLISIALANNRDLQIAVARMDEAQAIWGIQRGEMFPTLGAGFTGARQRSPAFGVGPNVITSQYAAGVAVTTFELDLFGRLRNLSEAAFQQYLATAEGARAVQITLVSDTAVQYFRLRLAQALVALTQQTLKARQTSYQLVKARFTNGVASEMDTVQAKVLVDAAAADLARYIRDEQTARNALSVLIGKPVPDMGPSPVDFDDAELLANIPAGLPSELLVQRPDIRAAENQLLAANANIGAARAAFLPNISLTGSVGTASTQLGNLFKSGSGAWAFTPSISVPIFTGGSLQASLAQSEAAQRAAIASYERQIQQAFREVADALSGEATLNAQLQARAAETAAAQKFLDLSNARFFNGISSFLEVQVAEIQLFNARVQQVLTGFETVSNRINLYKALGGGFEASAVQSKNSQPSTLIDTNPS
ncbi:efflux transporter outer membrane subunit [Orrella daihaiensis]|uniref:Efflux transporter outer membrane subunit n=1 Tax=Orrella daihaiensis TaxID=2782176 RepID=A0ABY4AQ95_9BURK|nr:efflux transporter outer membrane subunit [Orrella daihaiensis]UOD51202.1 efflux transporter outer membrane subunit [Orrella daihaiensis]